MTNEQKLTAQVENIEHNNLSELWLTGRLHYSEEDPKVVLFTADPDGTLPNRQGPWRIRTYPNSTEPTVIDQSNDYVAGIDDIYKPKTQRTAKSTGNCMVIYRRGEAPVALYTDYGTGAFRPENTMEVYYEFLKGLQYYDVQKFLLNYTHDAFVNFLHDQQQAHRLMYVGQQPGLEIKGRVRQRMNDLLQAFIDTDRYTDVAHPPLLHALFEQDASGILASYRHCFALALYADDLLKKVDVIDNSPDVTTSASTALPAQRIDNEFTPDDVLSGQRRFTFITIAMAHTAESKKRHGASCGMTIKIWLTDLPDVITVDDLVAYIQSYYPYVYAFYTPDGRIYEIPTKTYRPSHGVERTLDEVIDIYDKYCSNPGTFQPKPVIFQG